MKVYYDPRYVAAATEFDTTRKAKDVAAHIVGYKNVELVSPTAVSMDDLLHVHSADYIRAVRDGSSTSDGAGLGRDPGLWTAVCASTGGVVDASRSALRHGVAGSLSSGLHHARWDAGAGFCTFNGLALAAKLACVGKPARKVLILDLDAHCGGGTYSLISDDPQIWQIDISVSSFDSYTPRDKDRHRLHVLTRADDYLPTLRDELARAAKYEFDLVLYNAGMDPHEHCDIGGLPGISDSLIALREHAVFYWARALSVPIAFVLAGGYTGARMSASRLASLHGLTVANAGLA